jgi:hypothetical protein
VYRRARTSTLKSQSEAERYHGEPLRLRGNRSSEQACDMQPVDLPVAGAPIARTQEAAARPGGKRTTAGVPKGWRPE